MHVVGKCHTIDLTFGSHQSQRIFQGFVIFEIHEDDVLVLWVLRHVVTAR